METTSPIFMSSNKGKTWKNISENLPKNTILWRVVQDHVRKDLFFLGTEFGFILKQIILMVG